MNVKKLGTKLIACVCMTTVVGTSVPTAGIVKAASHDDPSVNVMLDSGGYKTEVFGVGTDNWGKTWVDRKKNLPPETTYLTDHYRETVGTVPTSDWASSVVFDQYSESLYAHPLAFRAASNGMQMASPAVVDSTSYVDGEPSVESLLTDDTVELVVGADGFSAVDARVDKTTDWTYEIVMANTAGTSSMRSTLAKGTPYAYYAFENLSPTISLGAGATDFAIYKNNSNILGVSITNKKDGKTHYYGVYAPSGTTWTNAGGKLTAKFPSGKSYLSIAILPDNSEEAFTLYEKYAFNFITDTKVEWEYHENASKVYTRYNVVTKNMETGAEGGDTIIALYPHQWRYLMDGSLTDYTYATIRGKMKTVVGSSYVTEMTYNGMVTGLPVTTDEEKKGEIIKQLSYLWDYRKNKDDPKWIVSLEGQYGGFDTYWVGKNLNTMTEAIFLADQLSGDETVKGWRDEMVEGVANYLQFWFNPGDMWVSGDFVDSYFYYHEPYGTLIGYPSSYTSDKEVNDHHFHYGYWIKAAAAVAMNNPEWADEWGGMVYEMISDIANTNRDGKSYNENSPAKYPFLRNFDIYEGHSWASGVANYEYDADGNMIDPKGGLSGGNNQESSSEAVNAWVSLVLWGEAVGDKRIRDLGIYLYTTEIAAVEDYYYDLHNEIFTDAYEDKDNYNIQTVTRLFGGRYDHTAWWTVNSIEVTTITMLPLSGATLYLGKNKDKVKAVVDSISENSKQWTHFVATKNQSCANFGKEDMLTDPETNQDVVAMYYAYYDADAALEMWDSSDSGKVENGESRAHTMAYITSLKEYGTQNFDITGSTPLSLVLEKDGKKTYIAENRTNEEKRVYFSDGTYVDVPANSRHEGAKTGDGENPNVDDSDILGEKKKVNLEVYCEKLDGSGYDMTSSTVNVKADAATYTYQPAELKGFTFDGTNAENKLTVNVTEGSSETLKAYYKRNSYTVEYTLNGGTVSGTNPTSYRYGQSLQLTAPTKEGYTFEGWFTDAGFTGAAVTAITPTTAGNLKMYAKFVREGAVTGVSLDKTSADLKKGETLTLNVTVQPSGATDKGVTWISSDETVATVSKDGVVTAVGEGRVVITAVTKDGEYIAQCDIFVKADETTPGGSEYERGDKGVEIGADGKLVLYVANTDKTAVVAHYNVFDTKEAADAVKNVAVGGMPGYNMEKTAGGAHELKTDKPDDSKYLAYAFNAGILEFPIVIAVKDIPVVGGGSGSGSTKQTAAFTVNHYLQAGSEYVLHDKVERVGIVGETINEKPITRTGYTFNSTRSKTSGEVKAGGGLVLDLYYDSGSAGEEKKAAYTVIYYLQNAQGEYDEDEKKTLNGTVGETVTATQPSKTGYKVNASKSTLSGAVTADGSLTLKVYYDKESTGDDTQKAAYTVIYYLQNAQGEYDENEKKTFSDTIGENVTAAAPSRAGYNLNTAKSTLSGTVTADGSLTLKVYYDKKASDDDKTADYTVIYYLQDAKGEYVEDDQDVLSDTVGENVSVTAPDKTGYKLNTQKSILSGEVKADNSLELKVYYDRATYKITYVLGDTDVDNSANEETYMYGVMKALQEPKRTGYVFVGWYEDEAHEKEISAIAVGRTGDITVYAAWEKINEGAVTHKITYVLNGGTATKDLLEFYEESVGRDLGTPTYEGREFLGWYTDADFKDDTRIVSIPAGSTTDYVLYARWSEPEGDVVMHVVKYVIVPDKIIYPGRFEEGKETQLIKPTRDGYTFLGWYTTPDFTVGTGIVSIPATQKTDLTVYARWLSNDPQQPEKKNYTVTFDSNGGTDVTPKTVSVAEGQVVAKPVDPTRAGYQFAGWNYGTAVYNFASPVSADIILVAQWKPLSAPVSTIKVTEIKLYGEYTKLAVGKKARMAAEVSPQNASNASLTWSVDAKYSKYVSVNASTGLVQAKKAKLKKAVNVVIKATANDGSNVTAEYKLKIMPKAVKKIKLKASSTFVKAGRKVKVKATVTPSASSSKINKKLKWSSSNTKYATVTSKGIVKTKKAGKGKVVKITARSTDGTNKKKTIKIRII